MEVSTEVFAHFVLIKLFLYIKYFGHQRIIKWSYQLGTNNYESIEAIIVL